MTLDLPWIERPRTAYFAFTSTGTIAAAKPGLIPVLFGIVWHDALTGGVTSSIRVGGGRDLVGTRLDRGGTELSLEQMFDEVPVYGDVGQSVEFFYAGGATGTLHLTTSFGYVSG